MRSWIGTSSQNVDADTGAQAGASDELDWVDTLTLRSPILPVGTPVDFLSEIISAHFLTPAETSIKHV